MSIYINKLRWILLFDNLLIFDPYKLQIFMSQCLIRLQVGEQIILVFHESIFIILDLKLNFGNNNLSLNRGIATNSILFGLNNLALRCNILIQYCWALWVSDLRLLSRFFVANDLPFFATKSILFVKEELWSTRDVRALWSFLSGHSAFIHSCTLSKKVFGWAILITLHFNTSTSFSTFL